jgi:hypothetical protein
MPGKRIFLATTLVACAAFGQSTSSPSRTFSFSHSTTPQTLQEAVNTIRSVGDIRDVTADAAKQAITVTGTTDQLSLAAWICNELDQTPAPRQALVQHEYPGTVPQDHVVRVFYLAHMESPQDLQSVVNLTRSIADIQRFFPFNTLSAIVSRGTPEQTDLAAWMLNEVDQPSNKPLTPGAQSRQFPADARANMAQIFVLTNTQTPQATQEIVNATRTVADIQRCFPFYSRKILAMRGSADQIAFADWVLKELDKPAGSPAPDAAVNEYRVPAGLDKNGVARVYIVNNIENPEALQQLVRDVRSNTGIQRAYPVNQPKALAIRGTGDQIARADQIIKERDRP